MFSAFFAAYAVLSARRRAGRAGAELFDLQRTSRSRPPACSLSSFTCGLAAIGARARNTDLVLRRHGTDLPLGAGFLGLEVREFAGHDRAGRRADPQRVPVRLLHPGRLPRPSRDRGLLWLLTMMAQVFAKGFRRRHSPAGAVLQPVLARARHHLGRDVHGGLSYGSPRMNADRRAGL